MPEFNVTLRIDDHTKLTMDVVASSISHAVDLAVQRARDGVTLDGKVDATVTCYTEMEYV